MASDEPRLASHTAESTETLDQPPVLVVDPDALNSAARFLDDPLGPQSPYPAPPAAAIGHPGLAHDIAAFDQRYRAVELALASDDDTTSAHLVRSAATYTRAESEAFARLAEFSVAPPPIDPDSTDSNIRDDQNSDLRQV
jgi:hypothetical protein